MSTRAHIIVKDNFGEIILYRHNDGYPSGVTPILTKFVNMIRNHEIRNNASQSAGWLIVLGREELIDAYKGEIPKSMSWKVGTIEPEDDPHIDTDYTYVIDLSNHDAAVYCIKGHDDTTKYRMNI